MVGHEDVPLLRIQIFQSLDLDAKPGEGEVDFGPIGEAAMTFIAASIKQTRQTASQPPKNGQQDK